MISETIKFSGDPGACICPTDSEIPHSHLNAALMNPLRANQRNGYLLKMMNKLSVKDIFILGLMNFAFFVGAGNIIFPPFIGLQAGANVWQAAAGFLITGVGLPVIAAIAMARTGGELEGITKPMGKTIGMILTIVCYLCIGPLFATPRTATVSYALAFQSADSSNHYAFLYSLIYFAGVIAVSLYPGQLLNIVGKILAPVKTTALFFLSITALLYPANQSVEPVAAYQTAAFSQGLVNGYLTMDTLASLVFGLLIVNALRVKGITAKKHITRYAIIAGLIAGACLIFIYLGLFKLGTSSTAIAANATNGTAVLSAYVNQHFGMLGTIFLSVLITIACFVTAVGLTCACGSYFADVTRFQYKHLVWFFALFSMLVSNVGLTELIKISVPALTAIYPIFIVLILASFIQDQIATPKKVIAPTAFIALLFGIYDGVTAAGLDIPVLNFVKTLPLYNQGIAWLLPTTIVFVICYVIDAFQSKGDKAITQPDEA